MLSIDVEKHPLLLPFSLGQALTNQQSAKRRRKEEDAFLGSLEHFFIPQEVPLPTDSGDGGFPAAPFLQPQGWLEDFHKQVQLCLDSNETNNNSRVSPVAVVRFSRGGKTRALTELANLLHEKKTTGAIIFVSFNNATPLQNFEKEEGALKALCRRILFAAYKETDLTYHEFANRTKNVSQEHVNNG